MIDTTSFLLLGLFLLIRTIIILSPSVNGFHQCFTTTTTTTTTTTMNLRSSASTGRMSAMTNDNDYNNNNKKLIYDVPNSGWTSSMWNWGYASGTGHDCAAICRRMYTTRQARSKLVRSLIDAPDIPRRDRTPQNFEEVKLVLALAWQRGRWDGSDGGRGGYGDVLATMADARRYEVGPDEECSIFLVEDMQRRYQMLDPSQEDLIMMETVLNDNEDDVDAARRVSSGLVLKSMGFIENGL